MPRTHKQPTKETHRVRAGKACRRCNQKRIKCDAMLHIPCTNCAQCGNLDCELRQSRRGTYIRKPFRHGESPPQTRRTTGDIANGDGHDDGQTTSGYAFYGSLLDHSLQEPDNNGEARPDTVGDAGRSSSTKSDRIPVCPPEYILNTPGSQCLDDRANVESSQLNPSILSDQSLNNTKSPTQQPSSSSDSSTSSYRDISWSTMFDHFLNNRTNSREFLDKCSITYFGESFPLAIVLEDINEGGRPKLHHPGPPFPAKEPRTDVPDQLQPAHILSEDMQYLRMKGVFEIPEKSRLGAFVNVFLERVYPAYPIVSRQELIQQHKTGQIPLILLQSICFIAATFCPLSVLHQAGFQSRKNARFFYYKKVKLLFDSGYEIDKIVILQSAIMMSFWGGGPNNYWNFYSWISTAVTMAEAIGIHRSTATTNMKSQDKSLLRRIWWVLVVRDSACSALVGRPFRIDMDQSDIEMLSLDDFAHDAPTVPNSGTSLCHIYAQYQIEIAKLSLVLRDIVMSRFYPGRPLVRPAELHARLNNWREKLPPDLRWRDKIANPSNPFSMTLSIQYSHHLILIYLGHMSKDCPTSSKEECDHNTEITGSAAQHIATVACTVVTKSSVLLVPHELFHGIFMAQAVFYTKLRSSNLLLAELGRSALTNCQMVLHESCECWDPSPWIMQLFDSLSTRLSEKQPVAGEQTTHDIGPNIGSGEQPGLSLIISSDPEAGVFNGLLGYDPWQSNPMLSSLFDLPTDMLLHQ